VFPVEQPDLKQRLIREVLATSMADNTKARELLPNGSHRRVQPTAGQPLVRSQEHFLEVAAQNAAKRLKEVPVSPAPYVAVRPPATRRPRKRQTK
jgi:polyphosphate kinase